MQKIDELKEPPIVGKTYLVPCIIEDYVTSHEDTNPNYEVNRNTGELELERSFVVTKWLHIYPIINHKHHDKENGQEYYHYHIDYRFIELTGSRPTNDLFPIPKFKGKFHRYAPKGIRYNLLETVAPVITYYPFKCLRTNQHGIAESVDLHKLPKDHCIHNNKCPHKGYDLSQEVPGPDGVLTCPLHGLRFRNNRIIGK